MMHKSGNWLLFLLKKAGLFLSGYRYFCHLFVLALSLVPLGITFSRSGYGLTFNGSAHNSDFIPLSDKVHSKGRSKVNLLSVIGCQLITELYLKSGYEYPFAGISVNFNRKYQDLSQYDYLKIRITSAEETNLSITLETKLKNARNENGAQQKCLLSSNFLVKQGTFTYSLKMNDFEIPDWWKEAKAKSYPGEKDVLRALERVENMSILCMKYDAVPNWEKKITFLFHKIGFYQSDLFFFILSLVIVCSYLLCLVLLRLMLKRKFKKKALLRPCSEKTVQLDYKKLQPGNYHTEELEKICFYMSQHYHEADITVRQVYEQTGISPLKISRLLKSHYNSSFKQLINRIRILEAKRLLLETDRNINDIAFLVGYNNLSYFYRVFKAVEQTCPGEIKRSK